MFILYALLAPVVHEAAHYAAAFLFGKRIIFRRVGVRLVWTCPQMAWWKMTLVRRAGFMVELGLIPFLPWAYQMAALLHFWLYPFYCGEYNDFGE